MAIRKMMKLSSFTGFPEEMIRFFLALRLHNDHVFFMAHEAEYKQYVKAPLYAFIDAIAPAMLSIANDIEVRPAKCLARIRRDTRFTKDKSPYRDHMWLLFRRSGEPREASVMYWFEISPEAVEWGLGFWGDNRPALDALRRRIVHQPGAVSGVLDGCRLPSADLALYGESYKRMQVPAAIPEELQPYYSRKSLYIKRSGVPLSRAYQPDILDLASADMIRLKPMYELLRACADEGMSE